MDYARAHLEAAPAFIKAFATADESEVRPHTGGYWHHHGPRDPHRSALDASFQDEVFEHLQDVTSLRLDRRPG